MDAIHQQIKEVGEQAEYLFKRISDLMDENKKLKSRLGKLESQVQENAVETKSLKEKGETIELAKSLNSSGPTEASEELKKRINRYIREIDQCLKLINE